jgi:PhnB protein
VSTKLFAYVNFAGNTAEAMRYYQSIFGGELTILTFGHFSVPGMPADGTMHSMLEAEGFSLLAADAQPGTERTWIGSRVALSLMGDDVDRLTEWFDKLAADGTMHQPLAPQVWGDTFGAFTDKFGVEWLFNISEVSP